jgi:hypothetical protein
MLASDISGDTAQLVELLYFGGLTYEKGPGTLHFVNCRARGAENGQNEVACRTGECCGTTPLNPAGWLRLQVLFTLRVRFPLKRDRRTWTIPAAIGRCFVSKWGHCCAPPVSSIHYVPLSMFWKRSAAPLLTPRPTAFGRLANRLLKIVTPHPEQSVCAPVVWMDSTPHA